MTDFESMPDEVAALMMKAVLKEYRAYHIKTTFVQRHKSPLLGQWLVPAGMETNNTPPVSRKVNALTYDVILRRATSETAPTKTIVHISNLDFRPLTNFINSGLSAMHKARLARAANPKIIAILDFNGDEIQSKAFGQWLAFSKSSNVRVEYMMGEAYDQYKVSAHLVNLSGSFDEFQDLMAIYTTCIRSSQDRAAELERIKALYAEVMEDEPDSDGEEIDDRATATRRVSREMAKKMTESKLGKGGGLGALFGQDTVAGASEEMDVSDGDESEDGEVDSDPDNMSSSDDDDD